MKFLIIPVGSAGDVHPLIGLGQTLRDRGHDTVVVLNEYFMDVGRRAGLTCVEMGSTKDFLSLANDPQIWDPLRAFAHVFRRGVSQLMRDQYEFISSRQDEADLAVISSCLAFGARIAGEKLGLPLFTVHLQPAVLWSGYDTPCLPGLTPRGPRWLKNGLFRCGEAIFVGRCALPATNAFRKELNLKPVRRISQWWHSPDGVVGLFPEWFAPYQPDWPAKLVLTDFPLWDESQVWQPDEEVESFLKAGPPPIVFAPGSAMMFGRDFFETATEVCARLGKRGILLSRFHDHLPRTLPEGVCHFDYIPFSHVLPRSAALVHHGGIGTTAQALAAGIPQLVRPMAHDQPDNAHRLARLGVGDWLSVADFTVASVCAKLEALWQTPHVAQNCRRWAEQLTPRNGLDLAAAAIEGFAARDLPSRQNSCQPRSGRGN